MDGLHIQVDMDVGMDMYLDTGQYGGDGPSGSSPHCATQFYSNNRTSSEGLVQCIPGRKAVGKACRSNFSDFAFNPLMGHR